MAKKDYQHYGRDALWLWVAFIVLILIVPPLAWIVLLPAIVGTRRAIKRRKNNGTT